MRWNSRVFAARIHRTTPDYSGAHHPPVPVLSHPDTRITSSGESFGPDPRHSRDPDGDNLSHHWFASREAGTARDPAIINGAENAVGIWVTAPKVTQPEAVHIIHRLTDKGSPALTRYQRILFNVTP